jgi:CBS domain-containing protein
MKPAPSPKPAKPASPQLDAADRIRIGDLMTRTVVTVHADLGIEELVELLLDRGLSRVPVVDDEERLIGFVSKTDLVVDQHVRGDNVEVEVEVEQLGAGGRGRHVHEVSGLVRDVMTPAAFSLPATASLGEAARRMLADNLHAVVVTDAGGKLIGMLSATDVVAWVAGVERPSSTPS